MGGLGLEGGGVSDGGKGGIDEFGVEEGGENLVEGGGGEGR